ncbi:MAG: MFS transporter [Pseudomonadota bacterium]
MTLARPLALVALLQAANFCSGLGNAMVTIAIPWLVMERLGSATLAGVVLALASLPPLLIAPVSGWMVDHVGRRFVSVGADILSALSVLAIPLVALLHGLTPTTVMLLAVIGALFDPAGYTARKALLTDTARATGMGQERLNGIHEGVFGVAWIAGPALGAWLIAGFGSVSPFWGAAALFLVSAGCIALLRVGDLGIEARARGVADAVGGWPSVLRGFVVLWQDRLLRTMTVALVVIATIYLPTESIVLTAYFEELGEPAGLGTVVSAMAAGATLGAFGYGWLSARLSQPTLLRLTLAGTAFSILPMALLPPLPWLTAAAFFLGFCWGPLNPLVTTLIQKRVPPDQHGRVYSAQMSLFYAAPPLGMVLAGAAVERWGVADTYLALGAALTVTALAVCLSRPLRTRF